MSLFSAFLGCLMCSKSPVSDDVGGAPVKEYSPDHKTKRKSKSSGAPIVVSYFPVNSNISQL
ncbi:hypothetical protein I3842_13G035200 [Carya illinoinensis]|uniref:Uncharacterized protein n=1 Tax=Carya illinoinensis TaxID=32201 RepID=A0A922AJS2_CARIL|nr:hypothetical protein I3842_13G035200 [Carya illinoinensis]